MNSHSNTDKRNSTNPWRFCVAPMMEWSDRHCRYFWRLMSRHARLYTEMVVSGAIIHGDRARFLNFNTEEHPIALQVGGSDPKELSECAQIAEDWGYDEINLNCGCPSDRVQKGKIGAILMHEPELVADCIDSMIQSTSIPVTVKHRIGVDNLDNYDELKRFVQCVSETGCETFIVHARKAWLSGLSPKENREIPPLKYDTVIQLKQDFPDLNIVINGGITDLKQTQHLLENLDGVMMGREAYAHPYVLAQLDQILFDSDAPVINRMALIERYADYCDEQLKYEHTRLHHMSRHTLGLFAGQAGGKNYRRYLSENAPKADKNADVLRMALKIISKSAPQA